MTIRSSVHCAILLGVVACSSDDQAGGAPSDSGAADTRAPTHPDAQKEPAKDAAKPPPPKDAGREGAAPDAAEAGPPYPNLLSETGLYADIAKGTLATGVRPYDVQYPLWSDGADKERWVYLPPGTKIDTSDMDFWKYPAGTKAWKQFSIGGKRIETRMQYKPTDQSTDWVMIAYQWKADGSDAIAVPAGVQNASGTQHDIPSTDDCQFCHSNMLDRLLGFNAIQLSHSLPGLTISELITEKLLSNPPAGPFTIPGNAVERDAIGYLHGNCGDCHNPNSFLFASVDMQLWESTKTLDTVKDTTVYRTAVNQPDPGATTNRIVPGDPEHSVIYEKMGIRGSGQMPPIGTEVVDTAGRAKVGAWISSLPSLRDGGTDGGVSRDGGPDAGTPRDSGGQKNGG